MRAYDVLKTIAHSGQGTIKRQKLVVLGLQLSGFFSKRLCSAPFVLKFFVGLFPLEIKWKPEICSSALSFIYVSHSFQSVKSSQVFSLSTTFTLIWMLSRGPRTWSKGNLVWGYFSSFLSFRFVVAYQDTWHCTFQWSSRQLQILLQRWGWRSVPRALLVEVFVQFSRLAPRHS